jgi:hypothetical protein
MSRDRVVLCMKWGTLYPADYVNVLCNASRRHLTGAFRFVCLTDDAPGLVRWKTVNGCRSAEAGPQP